MSHALPAGPPPPSVSVAELRAAQDVLILDVRSREEFAEGHVGGAVNLPVEAVAAAIPSLSRDRRVVTVCTKGGGRSQGAARSLLDAGFPEVAYLEGGWLAWRAAL